MPSELLTPIKSEEFTTVLLIDDHQVFLRGLRLLIEQIPGMIVCAEASSAEQAMEILNSKAVDLVIADIFMPGNEDLKFLRHLKQVYPDLALMVLSQCMEPETISKVMDIGVSGYILKNECFTQVELALAALIDGKTYFGQQAEELLKTLPKTKVPLLSPREKQVAKLVAEGKTNKAVVKELNCSEFTIKTHKANLMRKIGAHNAVEVSIWVRKNFSNL